MWKVKLTCLFFLSIFAVVTLGGCASTKQARQVEGSGFLDDYSILRKGQEGEAARVYRYQFANWNVYHRILLDPVAVWIRRQSEKEVSRKDVQRLANNFYALLYDQLSRDFDMVTAPESQTLRIQIAITDIEKSSAALDTITTVVPVGFAISKGKEFVTGKPSFVGEVSIEFKVVSAASGKLLAAGIDRRVGGKTIKEIDSWTDANNAIEDWSKVIRYRLCKLQGGGSRCIEP
jgi:hypothetical protein